MGAGEVVIGIDAALGPDEGMVEDVAVPALGEVISDPDVLRFLRFGSVMPIRRMVMEITEVSVATVHHVTVVDDGIPGVEYLRRFAADKWEILVGASWELLPDCSEEEAAFGAWSGGGIAA